MRFVRGRVPEDKIRHVHIKGKVKNMCLGCIAAIKGMM